MSLLHRQAILEALEWLAVRCPKLTRACYWAGTSAIAIDELGHRESYGLDFHTRRALRDVRRQPIPIDVMANFDAVPPRDLTVCRVAPAWKRPTLRRYLRDKLQCVVERAESRDLVDIQAVVLTQRPELVTAALEAVRQLDAILLVQRLRHWTDDALANDLRAYPGVDWRAASQARELLLDWVRG